MALTKERKILIAVAGLACGVFLLDRVLMGGALSGPSQAQAAGPSVISTAANPGVAAVTPAVHDLTIDLDLTAEPVNTTSLAQRLAHAGRQLPDTTPDAFRASARWQNATPTELPAASSPSFDPRAFADRNPLDAVFASPRGATAMVAGRALRQGDVREGMTLTDIGDRWVVWTGGGVRVKVHLDPAR